MKNIEFTKEQKMHIVYKIKHYFNRELGEEIAVSYTHLTLPTICSV